MRGSRDLGKSCCAIRRGANGLVSGAACGGDGTSIQSSSQDGDSQSCRALGCGPLPFLRQGRQKAGPTVRRKTVLTTVRGRRVLHVVGGEVGEGVGRGLLEAGEAAAEDEADFV